MTPFNEQHDARAFGGRMLIFLAIFTPLFLFVTHLFLKSNHLFIRNYMVYIAICIPLLFAVTFNLISFRSHRPIQWIVTSTRIIYESPSRLFGNSFNIPVSDLVNVSNVGDTDFANLNTISGDSLKFYIHPKGGRIFFHHLNNYTIKMSNKII